MPTDNEIEMVARRMCEADQLSPDEEVGGSVTDFGPNGYREGDFVPDVCVYQPRWRKRYYAARNALIAAKSLALYTEM